MLLRNSADDPASETILVTGGAGFIGSAYIRWVIGRTAARIVNVDMLTYAGNLDSLASVADSPRYAFEQLDIVDTAGLRAVFRRHRPDAVVHMAAESHVDRSIDAPSPFIQSNIVGTASLLEVAREYWDALGTSAKPHFRFHHVSTDEVYGSLGPQGLFTEDSPYLPNSPYSASKAAADHLVRAWHHTFGLPAIITNCSNNYGPCQFPEKLIPVLILNALHGRPLPIYGTGDNVRDWLFVDDHVEALLQVLSKGTIGETYNIGGNSERSNLQVATIVCDLLDELLPASPHRPHRSLITFVADRPGHDKRYAIDSAKITAQLGWRPREDFESGLRRTIEWYLANRDWWQRVQSGAYRRQGAPKAAGTTSAG